MNTTTTGTDTNTDHQDREILQRFFFGGMELFDTVNAQNILGLI